MLRVLMVLEDYGELMFLQTVLKKLGFDVDAIQNPRSLGDSVLVMNPDVLVMTAFGKKVKGSELCSGVRRVRGVPRIILMHSHDTAADPHIQVDGWLESPVPALVLLNMLGDLCGLDKTVLADKYQKLQNKELEEKTRTLIMNDKPEATFERPVVSAGNFGNLQESTMPSSERLERNARFLKEEMPKEHGFSLKSVAEQVRTLRREEGALDLSELERQRKAFVEHLFKKKA